MTPIPPYVPCDGGGDACCLPPGPAASRPAANAVSAGSIYYETDTGDSWISDGSSWYQVNTVPGTIDLFSPFANVPALPAVLALGPTTHLVEVGGGIVTLPAAAPVGKTVRVKDYNGNATALPITVVPPGGETIDLGASVTLDSDFSLITFAKASPTNWIAA